MISWVSSLYISVCRHKFDITWIINVKVVQFWSDLFKKIIYSHSHSQADSLSSISLPIKQLWCWCNTFLGLTQLVRFVFSLYFTRRYSPLHRLSSSSCGGLWPLAQDFLYCFFWYFLMFSSNLSNFEKIQKKLKSRQGSPVDRRTSTAEAPPIGKIHHFSKITVTFKPVMGFWCSSGFRKFWITIK